MKYFFKQILADVGVVQNEKNPYNNSISSAERVGAVKNNFLFKKMPSTLAISQNDTSLKRLIARLNS